MPVMAYLALDDPSKLTRVDYARLAFATARGEGKTLPFSAHHLQRFETEYCYDRYFEDTHREGWRTRMMCCGHAFVMTGDANSAFFTDSERGLLGQFRHQYFVLGLLAHFHKAALLMISDRLVSAIKRLDIDEVASVRRFRRDIRQTLEIFLRFTHRYWYHEISDQAQLRDVFQMWTRHLGSEGAYREVREELHDMGQYDGSAYRRHDRRPDRNNDNGLPGHEPAGLGGCATARPPFFVSRGAHPDSGADHFYCREITAPCRVPGQVVR
jgi:hypothetical protein